jgi:hypothetical protein
MRSRRRMTQHPGEEMDRGVVRRIESAGELSCHHQMVERGPKSQMANLLVVLDVGRGGEARASQKVFM